MIEQVKKINVEPAVFLFLFGVYLMDLPGRWVSVQLLCASLIDVNIQLLVQA